uniref:Uncharacterized protein n=1 Tax=Oryza nivara TaxID=4536 RepID=A0A0E0IR65_ORYNI
MRGMFCLVSWFKETYSNPTSRALLLRRCRSLDALVAFLRAYYAPSYLSAEDAMRMIDEHAGIPLCS